MFWVYAAALLCLAALFIAWPLLRSPRRLTRVSREATVKALYRDRLAEIANELHGGTIAAEDREQVEAELGSSLLADYAADSTALNPTDARLGRGLVVATVLLVIAGVLFVYNGLGDPAADRLLGAESLLRLDPEVDREALLVWQEKLRERVAARPADAQSWYLLGHSELQLAEYQRSSEAFAMAYAQFGADPNIDIYWLQARYLAANGQVDSATRSIAERILQRDPNHPLVLEMYAIDAYQSGDYRTSVGHLNRALSRAINPSQRAALQDGMREARTRLGNLTPSLDVAIAVSGDVPHGATLFVIARPMGGGMPFAVVRRPAVDFPRSIRLDDAVSMNPAQTLSQAGAVEVVVRLSLNGTPMAQSGDWEWRSQPIELAALAEPLQLDATLAAPGPDTGEPNTSARPVAAPAADS
ncbi:MAG: c-type cytochrome biogenesis protein CcmI [Pseudomonadales bacterium]